MNRRAETQHERDLEYIRNFRLIDDDFMKKVFEDRECVQLVLRKIIEKEDLNVTEVKTEYVLHNLQGRSVRIDIKAVDEAGKIYDIEIQRSDRGAGRKRARHNSAMLDSDALKPGESTELLPETYVIFITENDVLKKGLPICHVDRIIRETGEEFGDGEHIIYVNSEIRDDTELGLLMHDFHCTDAEDMHYSVLRRRVTYFKESEEGVSSMCKAMEEMRAEAEAKGIEKGMEKGMAKGMAKGMEQGMEKGKAAMAESMKAAGISEEQIKKVLAMAK